MTAAAAPRHRSAPEVLRVDVECVVVSPNRLMGEHFRSRHWRRRRERRAVCEALNGKRVPPGPTWTVTLTRIASRTLDDDSLSTSFKAFRDEVSAFLGVDDRDPRVEWIYAQEVQRVPIPPQSRTKWSGAFKSWARVEIAGRSIGVPGQRCAEPGQLVPASCAVNQATCEGGPLPPRARPKARLARIGAPQKLRK